MGFFRQLRGGIAAANQVTSVSSSNGKFHGLGQTEGTPSHTYRLVPAGEYTVIECRVYTPHGPDEFFLTVVAPGESLAEALAEQMVRARLAS